jgi:hypothetical protein
MRLEDVMRLPGAAALGFLLFCSCIGPGKLPPADLSQAGWRAQQGQAIWKPPGKRPELAGDLFLATNAQGEAVLEFTKAPFSIATAQVASNAWQIEFGGGKMSWSGYGRPPRRFIWFQLPGAAGGGPLAPPWRFERLDERSWRLSNPRTGEFLEGEFFP